MSSDAVGVQQGCLITFRDDYHIDRAYILGADALEDVGTELWNALLTRGLIGFVRHGQRTISIRNIKTDPRWPNLPEKYFPNKGSAIGLPLANAQYVFGVMLFIHPEVDFFDDDKIALLEEIGHLASAALDNALYLKAAQQGYATQGSASARYQTLFEDAVVPIILTDMEGLVVDANQKAAEFLEHERTALLKLPITEVYPVEAATFKENYRMLGRGEEIVFKVTLCGKTHEDMPLMLRARQIALGDRDMIEWVAHDVSAQMEMEQLRHDLTAMVYHDLRGPLQAIKGSINKLGQVLANHENPAVWTLLQIGIRSTRQLQRMVDSLVDIQRLEEGKAVLSQDAIELRVLLGDSAQLVQPLAADMNHKLQFDVSTDIPMMMMDGDMIMRVVINLMENAIKYTPNGGTIKLSARIVNDKVRIAVRDSGPGIPHQMQPLVFDKFSRVKYHDVPKGVGLGLAFCRLAVEAHGGQIWVESEPGEGAEFIFVLPVVPVPEKHEEADSSQTSLATSA